MIAHKKRINTGGAGMNNKVVKNVNGQVGEGVGFERIRRITGYLVGTLDRFNNGKRAEVQDRVKHGLSHN
jgi:anaerobic ribonucleoside-triphosphate reductase